MNEGERSEWIYVTREQMQEELIFKRNLYCMKSVLIYVFIRFYAK